MRTTPQLVVDAGASHVAGGIFAPVSGGRLLLQEFALEQCTSDPSLEPGWLERTAEALAEVASRPHLRGPASLAVPGHLTLTKFIKTPVIAEAKRDQVIRFEAAQAIPYPLEAVTWDHRIVAGDGLDLEIMLTAVKREVMENLCAAAEEAGFPVKRAASSCLTLYRAFGFNYPMAQGPVLVVDIGARSTNLLMVGPRGQFFARTFALAGNAITAAVAEELRLDFAEAESVKLQVMADLPRELQDSPMAGAVRGATANFINRLQLEIMRTTGNFRWRSGATSPVAIYLTGGGSLLGGLAPALAQKFNVPVEPYDALRNVELSDRARAAGAAGSTHLLANLVGLAVSADEAGTEVGLLPPAVRATRAFRRRQPNLLGAATLVSVALLSPIWHYHRLAKSDEARAVELAAETRPINAIANRNVDSQRKIAALQRQIEVIQHLKAARSGWVDFMSDLQGRLGKVEDVWLDEIAIERAPEGAATAAQFPAAQTGPALKLRLSGRLLDVQNPLSKVSADAYARVKELLAGFAQSPFIAAIEAERFDNAQPGLLRFDFTLRVNPQHAL
ncbi:MAG: pilus assembly protein PilM [Opitutaceae bacterium]